MKENDVIFLSASVPYREEWIEGSKPSEIEEAIISIARAVFARKGRLLFGGHPSVSPLVSAIASEYFPPDPARLIRPVVTFQSEFFRKNLPDETAAMVRMGWSAIEWTEDRNARDPSLKLMRELMLPEVRGGAFARNELRPPLAMIAVGGMEGIRDEALVFLSRQEKWGPPQRPIICFRSGGAAAARLLEPNEHELWPKPEERPGPDDFKTLSAGRKNGVIVDIEAEWHAEHQDFSLPPDVPPLQPYATMVQWLLDKRLGRETPGVRAP